MSTPTCRFCLGQIGEHGSSLVEGTFRNVIERVFSFQVKQANGLSNNVCTQCTATVWSFHSYSLQVEQNQEKLQQQWNATVENPLYIAETPALDFVDIIKKEPLDHSADTDHATEHMISDQSRQGTFKNYFPDNYYDDDPFENAGNYEPYKEHQQAAHVSNGAAENPDEELTIKNEVFEFFQCEKYEIIPIDRCDISEDNLPTDTANIACSEASLCMENNQEKKKTIHDNGVECTICKKIIAKHKIKEHMITHMGAHRCDICDKTFATKFSLKTHSSLLHAADELDHEKLQCNQCNRLFNNNTQLKIHSRIHVLAPCPICAKMIVRFKMKEHIEAHKGFQCETCKKMFKKKCNLQSHHMLVHAPSNIHEAAAIEDCDQCDRSFINLKQLKVHQRKHTFTPCPVCKKMIMKYKASEHIAAHRGAFRCNICDRNFTTKTSVKTHKIKMHSSVE
ncbi:PR domain zinc finger protein 5-like [Anopheles nili]|uniref:PR domain zinc finger protein 5-like n=1 Tax=Anopheles nili TaxID=185578 RepID=UPI00237BCDD4|nr:PR domain zinc finger protein 5-like [Anopheles nili]